VLGSGIQAEAHLVSIPMVRTIREIRVWGRHRTAAERVVDAHKSAADVVRVTDSAEEAVTGADIIVTATTATAPILDSTWLSRGVHINAVGSCVPTARELDAATVAAACVFVDDREAALDEAGDLILAIADGAVTSEHLAGRLGDVIIGQLPGRLQPDEITLFESLGLGAEDIAAANHVYSTGPADDQGAFVRL